MQEIPHDPGLDNSLAFLNEAYTFIPERCARYESDVFTTRLLSSTVYCVSGAEAARMFYTPGRFTRNGAMPPTTLRLLQDKNSVQTLDGEPHRHRKQMFMDLVTPARRKSLVAIAEQEWRRGIDRWANEDEIVLLDAVREVLCRAACNWSGVPLDDEEATERSREFGAMIDGAASFGPRVAKGLWLRRRTERWARRLIERVRSGELAPEANSALATIAQHEDLEGQRLDQSTAAVELINMLRPVVAVARFITCSALALYEHPEARKYLVSGDEYARRHFAQEVRRFYPFFPCIGGRVREPFEWRGHRFEQGEWVLLDIYGTNHDPRIWNEPQAFRPQRFAEQEVDAYSFISQGGGDLYRGHRCPGEGVAVDLIEVALNMLTTGMTYEIPYQDMTVDPREMPAAPRERFRMRKVRARD
ncbi:cytochrome P450 [Salinisphaera sp.]|uniref:cytochrome P450 n=1 Tax=Salinisphaera sp. TaxID=1914330 RepID=UPI002D76A3BE|nr:cytochrome P450 [Salinisphaera sp.]HET7315564.1 cytochrome P450 [Salinisphaera sp.]